MRQRLINIILLLSAFSLQCSRKDVDRGGNIKLRGEKPVVISSSKKGDLLQSGTASWYGPQFNGRQTASGERFDMNAMTAAHKTLPFGTVLRVVNRDNGKEAIVRINDRGPFIKGRIIDLSKGAAKTLGVIGPGTAHVSLYLYEANETRSIRPSTKGHWTIQVGSYQEFERARSVYVRLEGYGMNVELMRHDGFYRIRTGRFRTEKEAERFCQQLKDDDLGCWILFVPT